MVKTVLEGLSILPKPPRCEGTPRSPVINLKNGLVLDDRMLEAPTLLLGSVGSGKSVLLEQIMEPILQNAEKQNENVIIFCAKKELLKYKRPTDPVIAVDATAPNACWNIFRELKASSNPELTARDIAKSLTGDQRSTHNHFGKTLQTIFSLTQ